MRERDYFWLDFMCPHNGDCDRDERGECRVLEKLRSHPPCPKCGLVCGVCIPDGKAPEEIASGGIDKGEGNQSCQEKST